MVCGDQSVLLIDRPLLLMDMASQSVVRTLHQFSETRMQAKLAYDVAVASEASIVDRLCVHFVAFYRT